MSPAGPTCRIDECTKPPKRGRLVCSMHAARQARHGDPGVVLREKRTTRGTCIVPDCGQPDYGPHGFCDKHRTRLRRHGDPTVVLVAEYQRLANGHIGYGAAHQRVRAIHGPAWRHPCRHCMARYAQDWAYDHNDADELLSPRGLAYSTDADRYIPLCRPCHRRFDAAYRPRQRDRRGRYAPAEDQRPTDTKEPTC